MNLEVAETVDMRLEEPVLSKVKLEAAGPPGVRLELQATEHHLVHHNNLVRDECTSITNSGHRLTDYSI